MELSRYEIALVAGGFTILGALISALASYWLARLLAERNAFIAARAKLRTAFAPLLGQIYLAQNHGSTHERPPVQGFLKGHLLGCAAAVEEFRPYVPTQNSAAYQKAWKNYHYFANDPIHATAADWTEELPDGGALEQRIQAILAYAKT